MDDIRGIINSIVKGCAQAGVVVPDVLAGFVARTIVESNSSYFALDRKATPEATQEVIMQSIEKLLEKDSPALEMIKMQVDYDSTYLSEETDAQNKAKARAKMIAGHKTGILEIEMEDSSDYEALTTLYRKIFRFLLEFAPNAKSADRDVEREIAAALESVFPRVGLKAFIQLNNEEKGSQLLELGRIILGIRLFNRDEGRGGAGIDNMDTDGNILANVLSQDIDREVEFFTDACAKYQKAIIKAHVQKRRKRFEKEREEEQYRESLDEYGNPTERTRTRTKAKTEIDEVSDYLVERWSQELANRRQYLGYLRTLQDEARFLLEKISLLCEKIRAELVNVRSLVTNKASVPKEVVYPRFDALGLLWVQLFDEVLVMIARSNTFQSLCHYRLSFNPTLTENYYLDDAVTELSLGDFSEEKSTKSKKAAKSVSQKAAASEKPHTAPAVQVNVPMPTVTNEVDGGASTVTGGGSMAEEGGLALDSMAQAPSVASIPEGPMEGAVNALRSEHDEDAGSIGSAGVGLGQRSAAEEGEEEQQEEEEEEEPEVPSSGARLLTAEDTPDFMLLPLELQGYCPWTIIEARGLLVPGKPALGIVQYEGLNYVCDHATAIKAFMAKPESYLAQIKEKALRNPEYIHLLRLHRWFPTASIARLLRMHEMETNNKTGMPLSKDASTGTPTHFVESYIDINYHWNEWELRRRALKMVNLKNCATSSQQTDASHFLRDNETQVYPHRIKGTQTKREKGTNPPTVTTYVAGLRGKQRVAEDRRNGVLNNNQFEGELPESVNQATELEYAHSGVVTLTLDMSSYHGYPLTSSGVKTATKK
eukprot:CAMPEP_0184971536 /NCGR_PEP_ID=MMETSP1098-20130426/3754_1 /TAXON_ID=89044 /ORGANISM="Spumella elongata, Strain CCAP 955/1" /LENGTH=822 /DNA_ID=CAMNT_0027493681 /DNA_START=33 /DNA_END=2501 /DNA_ORIENTATION=-